MRKTTIIDHLKPDELKRRMLQSEDREQFQRWQVIYVLLTKGFGAQDTADLVGVAQGTVYQWVHLYNQQGPQALVLQGRGGRRKALLSPEEEKVVLEEVATQAKEGTVVVAQTIRSHVEEKLGHSVSKDYAYDLLHRHGWRKVAPRPRHPKGDKAKQDAFKKNSRSSWMPPHGTLHQEMNVP